MGASRTCIIFITIHIIYAVTAQEMSKRIPQGFLGMRGKKYIESNENEFYKRKPQFFVGVKGKKNFEGPSFNTEYEYKRAPMGFVGMRGKKEMLYPDLMYPESYEYAPRKSGSFVGQIDYSADDTNYNGLAYPIIDEVINEFLQKLRANEDDVETSTVGEDNNEMTNEVEKRARTHQFFGVRGKKSIPEKRPYDLTFRGKFIGVRGKKDLKNSGAHEIKFLVNGPWPKRRGQMGFVGMRGKKWTDDATSDEVMPN